MKLIVGLGNPGEKYKQNRHNVGFMLLDYFLRHSGTSPKDAVIESQINEMLSSLPPVGGDSSSMTGGDTFHDDKFSNSKLCEIEIKSEKALLVKPQTFMNDSGKAVQKISKNNNLMPNDLIVIHDDLDIKLGEYKIQIGKGPKLHNGIESIENHLHTKEFTRVRIGVDNRSNENRIPGEAYVLQNFTPEELTVLDDVFKKIAEELC